LKVLKSIKATSLLKKSEEALVVMMAVALVVHQADHQAAVVAVAVHVAEMDGHRLRAVNRAVPEVVPEVKEKVPLLLHGHGAVVKTLKIAEPGINSGSDFFSAELILRIFF